MGLLVNTHLILCFISNNLLALILHVSFHQLLNTGNWIKQVYYTCLAEYKECLVNWYKGTGGGSGLDNMFESWSDEKKNKFDIDLAVYDHTDISNRPVILMDGYTKKKPYLTVIYMWDKVKDLILSAKYDPLKKGRGEAGLRRDTDDMSITSTLSSGGVSKCSRKSSSRSSSTSRPTDGPSAMATMVKEVINAVYKNEAQSSAGTQVKKTKKAPVTQLEDQSLITDIMTLVEKHQKYLLFLQECRMLTDERKKSIMQEIEYIFSIISSRSNKRTRT